MGKRVVIVGAGVTGLATAHALIQRMPDASLTLLERAGRPGGNIFTEREGGFVLDGGPDSWVSAKPFATSLARAVGLGDELIGTIEANRKVYVAWEGGLTSLPEGFVLGVPTRILPIVTTPLFSLRAKARMAMEPFVPRKKNGGSDESIESFVSRRLGREVTDRLVAPLLGGIYGGDASELSVRATLPQFVEAEARHGSLVMAMRQQRRARQAAQGGSAFVTVRSGIGALIDRLAAGVQGRLRTGVKVSGVSFLPAGDPRGRVAVDVEGGEAIFADDVVLAVPAVAAAGLLSALDARVSELLGAIPHASTAVVFLGLKRSDVARPLDATGYIVPRSLASPVLAATWVSSKWEGRAPSGMVLLRVFIGGRGRDELVARDDAELVRLAREEVSSRMGVPEVNPVLTRVYRFMHASAQPLVGHLERIAEVTRRLEERPGVHVAGSGYEGVGIPDCVRQAEKVAETIAGK